MSTFYQKIILPTRPQADTILAIFLLKKFGREKYPGIEKAEIEVWNNLPENATSESLFKKGFFLIDIGGGKFDHHFKEKTASQLIGEDLKITEDPALNKLLTYAERDDKYGLGTISSDLIDKAFGLSALITNLNKILPQSPQKIVELIMPIIHAHYKEENRRLKELPEEFEQKLKEGEAEIFTVKQGKKKLKVITIESINPSIIGWLRSSEGQKADVVLQKIPSGHTNILTRPLKKINLRSLIIFLRKEELACHGQKYYPSTFVLAKPGRIPQVPEWYYDKATNSIQNGGLNPKGTPKTAISFKRAKEIVKKGLEELSFSSFQRNNFDLNKKFFNETQNHQYFFEIHIPFEIAVKIREMISGPLDGIKLHLPENYHSTLIYLGEYEVNELSTLVEKIQLSLEKTKPFSIEINSKNLNSGKIPGYQAKAFYFAISNKKEKKTLQEIHSKIEKEIPRFQSQEFSPHLTVAVTAAGIEEKVIQNAEIKLKKNFKIEFSIDRIRLTEIIKKSNNQIIYKTNHCFFLK